MFDLPARLVVAYGLIALMVLAVAALVWWGAHNTQHRRSERAKHRLAERYRQREEAARTAADH